ncbi:hypothetical protein [Phormidium sp. CCY1219]|uniref:hypothetical protein n=1 Tax=Phormidium sp. CCY1219 TaxID=2886104 RepID=UPI002D1EBA26|nr:hypothetical protein [Phormidium sp. CCY1219]MEB3828340.1 hypothetical protein [Phormidium sp. CCY1219]
MTLAGTIRTYSFILPFLSDGSGDRPCCSIHILPQNRGGRRAKSTVQHCHNWRERPETPGIGVQ